MVDDRTFVNKVTEAVCVEFGENFVVKEIDSQKNNGVLISALSIQRKNENIGKLVSLDDYYTEYQNGKTIQAVVRDIVEFYRNTAELKINSQELFDFSLVKEKVVFRLINRKNNETLLKKMPYVPFQDLVSVFYILLGQSEDSQYAVMICNELMETWEIGDANLMQLALENSQRLLPAEFSSMKEILKDVIETGDMVFQMLWGVLDEEPLPMYVLTNRTGIFGAAVMMYPGVLQEVADYLEEDILILPSSVHEIIVMPLKENMHLEEMCELVKGINQTDVPKPDVLTDSVYIFRRESGKLEIVDDRVHTE